MPVEYYCQTCGKAANYGYGVHIRRNLYGEWYCRQHRPETIKIAQEKPLPATMRAKDGELF